MARIDVFERVRMDRVSLHGPTKCTYDVFQIAGGKRLFQLSTYGSNQRERQGQMSQTIQLTEESARQLLRILKEEGFDS